MESLSILSIVAIVIVVIWIIGLLSGKETKTVKKDLSATVAVATMKMRTNMEKSAITENLEWADDLLEEFGYEATEAIAESKKIQNLLLEPVTATKNKRTSAKAIATEAKAEETK